jgi:hypothetical protein
VRRGGALREVFRKRACRRGGAHGLRRCGPCIRAACDHRRAGPDEARVRLAPDPTSPGAGRALFTSSDETVRAAELNWIGDIHMTPVYPVGNSDFLLNPRTDLKSAAITGTPDDGDSTLQAEMAAFRFQR